MSARNQTNSGSTGIKREADGASPPKPAKLGRSVIARHWKTLPGTPGVYRLTDAKGQVLYVGQAKNPTKRVLSYTKTSAIARRITRLIAATAVLAFTTTPTHR